MYCVALQCNKQYVTLGMTLCDDAISRCVVQHTTLQRSMMQCGVMKENKGNTWICSVMSCHTMKYNGRCCVKVYNGVVYGNAMHCRCRNVMYCVVLWFARLRQGMPRVVLFMKGFHRLGSGAGLCLVYDWIGCGRLRSAWLG